MDVRPTCGCCAGYDAVFDDRTARRELKAYRRKGPRKTTRVLIDGLAAGNARGAKVLDIGGGVGAIAHELAKRGAAGVHAVDASQAYLETNRREAAAQGYAGQASYHLGDFVALAPSLPQADLVALDRVVCCYRDVEGLLTSAARKARRRLGLVLPRDDWWVRVTKTVGNLVLRIFRSPFRTYVHPLPQVGAVLAKEGLRRIVHERGLVWQADVYERLETPPTS